MINSEGLINDGLSSDCSNNGGTTWTYNQGVILAGLAELTAHTGNTTLLRVALSLANASMTHLSTASGILMEPSIADIDQLQFKGVFVRHLAVLAEAVSAPERVTLRSFLARNTASLLAHDRTADGKFGGLWQGPPGRDPGAHSRDGAPPALPNATGTVSQTSGIDLLIANVSVASLFSSWERHGPEGKHDQKLDE